MRLDFAYIMLSPLSIPVFFLKERACHDAVSQRKGQKNRRVVEGLRNKRHDGIGHHRGTTKPAFWVSGSYGYRSPFSGVLCFLRPKPNFASCQKGKDDQNISNLIPSKWLKMTQVRMLETTFHIRSRHHAILTSAGTWPRPIGFRKSQPAMGQPKPKKWKMQPQPPSLGQTLQPP